MSSVSKKTTPLDLSQIRARGAEFRKGNFVKDMKGSSTARELRKDQDQDQDMKGSSTARELRKAVETKRAVEDAREGSAECKKQNSPEKVIWGEFREEAERTKIWNLKKKSSQTRWVEMTLHHTESHIARVNRPVTAACTLEASFR